MTKDELCELQTRLDLSDNRMAQALGITRQTWRNWRTGRPCPLFAQNALRWLLELRRVSPANDNLPARLRFMLAALVSGVAVYAMASGDA